MDSFLCRCRISSLLWLWVCCLLVSGGCSGRPKNVAKKVTGVVTVGGQPIAAATVTFTPKDGSPSVGRTDAQGKYNLIWSRQGKRVIEGAEIGDHTVTIQTFQFGDMTAKPPKPEIPEKIPYKYRQESGFPKATVKAGENTINFELEAGPVDAPAPAKGKGKTKGKTK